MTWVDKLEPIALNSSCTASTSAEVSYAREAKLHDLFRTVACQHYSNRLNPDEQIRPQ